MSCPSIIGYLDPVKSGFRKSDYRRLLKDIYPGDVDPLTLSADQQVYQKLLTYAEFNGFIRRDVSLYNCQSILPIVGSVGWHNDEGMGLVMSWILYEEPLLPQRDSYNMQLITRKKALDLTPGHVFLFNANADHAWISNNKCVITQIMVKYNREKV